jgi:myo-inositol-1-phosphate synthase
VVVQWRVQVMSNRVGVWLVGGRGSVATTALTGAAAVGAGHHAP